MEVEESSFERFALAGVDERAELPELREAVGAGVGGYAGESSSCQLDVGVYGWVAY